MRVKIESVLLIRARSSTGYRTMVKCFGVFIHRNPILGGYRIGQSSASGAKTLNIELGVKEKKLMAIVKYDY
jgi:hypothetical protein